MRGFRLSGELVIALCVLALAVFLAVDTFAIGAQTYGRVGPRVFPIIVTVMMSVLGHDGTGEYTLPIRAERPGAIPRRLSPSGASTPSRA